VFTRNALFYFNKQNILTNTHHEGNIGKINSLVVGKDTAKNRGANDVSIMEIKVCWPIILE
jgi:hypothetical protein